MQANGTSLTITLRYAFDVCKLTANTNFRIDCRIRFALINRYGMDFNKASSSLFQAWEETCPRCWLNGLRADNVMLSTVRIDNQRSNAIIERFVFVNQSIIDASFSQYRMACIRSIISYVLIYIMHWCCRFTVQVRSGRPKSIKKWFSANDYCNRQTVRSQTCTPCLSNNFLFKCHNHHQLMA